MGRAATIEAMPNGTTTLVAYLRSRQEQNSFSQHVDRTWPDKAGKPVKPRKINLAKWRKEREAA